MNRLIRNASEPAADFDARVHRLVKDIGTGDDLVLRDARVVYVEGVLSGLQLAIAALQRRERVIDYLARWEQRHRSLRDQ